MMTLLCTRCPFFQTAVLHSGDQRAGVRSQASGLDLGFNVGCLGWRFARQRASKTLSCRGRGERSRVWSRGLCGLAGRRQGAHSTDHSGVVRPRGPRRVSPADRCCCGGLSAACPRGRRRRRVAGAGVVLTGEGAAAGAGRARDAALGVSMVPPVPHQPRNTSQLIVSCSKPTGEDSAVCN